VLGLVSRKAERFFTFSKHLPCKPSPDWFRENLTQIARRLKSETTAKIGLCSLCPIGENLDSDDPFQRELNRRVEEYSAIVAAVAGDENCRYIALYEAIAAEIRASPGRAFTAFRFLPFYRDAFRVLVLRRSADDVAHMNGWRFHTDGVHLNSRAGRIVADASKSSSKPDLQGARVRFVRLQNCRRLSGHSPTARDTDTGRMRPAVAGLQNLRIRRAAFRVKADWVDLIAKR
jgi:hypothetical protein